MVFALAAGIGAFTDGGLLWSASDLTIGAMTILNLFFVMKHSDSLRPAPLEVRSNSEE